MPDRGVLVVLMKRWWLEHDGNGPRATIHEQVGFVPVIEAAPVLAVLENLVNTIEGMPFDDSVSAEERRRVASAVEQANALLREARGK